MDFDKLILLAVAHSTAKNFHSTTGLDVRSIAAVKELENLCIKELVRLNKEIPNDYDWGIID